MVGIEKYKLRKKIAHTCRVTLLLGKRQIQGLGTTSLGVKTVESMGRLKKTAPKGKNKYQERGEIGRKIKTEASEGCGRGMFVNRGGKRLWWPERVKGELVEQPTVGIRQIAINK